LLVNRTLVSAAVAGLAVGALAALIFMLAAHQPGQQGESTGKALISGPFSLVDATGRHVTDKDFAGKPMLVYFGYTSCPDVCPAGLQIISAALDKLGDTAAGLTPIFITLDPEHDTPAVMGEYVKSFHPRIIGLTGSADEIAAVAKAYRIYYKKVADKRDPTRYSVDHSSFIYLMDGKGELVKHFPHTVGVDQLAAELAKAL
jgi:protein SCO1